ncbi:MAG: amidohydrolase family protein [Chromatiales bacterium]
MSCTFHHLVFCILLLWHATAIARPLIFDTHLHYSAADAETFTPEQIIKQLDRAGISRALVSGMPTSAVARLHAYAPHRIVAFLGLYRDEQDKRYWMYNPKIISYIKKQLDSGIYSGIGEFHIFAKDRRSPVLRRIVSIAAERKLLLQVHGDVEIIDEIFSQQPDVTVLWAHMGTRPEPKLLRRALERYPEHLFIDTSVRDERIIPNGIILPQWKSLFIEYQDRFLASVDTFRTERWQRLESVVSLIHSWLAQLPDGVARKLAYENAAKLFPVNNGLYFRTGQAAGQ